MAPPVGVASSDTTVKVNQEKVATLTWAEVEAEAPREVSVASSNATAKVEAAWEELASPTSAETEAEVQQEVSEACNNGMWGVFFFPLLLIIKRDR